MPYASREERILYLRNYRLRMGMIVGHKPKKTIEDRRAYHRSYYRDNIDQVTKLAQAKQQRLKQAAMAGYGSKCSCGETILEFLTLDHVNDDGARHRLELGKKNIYRWAVKNNFPCVLQCLCFNCNIKKGLLARQKDDLSKSAQTYRKQRNQVLTHYGATCSCCDQSDMLKLAIDHTHGGGCRKRKSGMTTRLYSHIIRAGFPPDYRVLCHNCNHSARMGGGVCIHQR